MKQLLLGGATLLALAASGPAARATLFDFTYSGSLVTFTVPTTDTYQILAFGAQGGSGTFAGGVGAGGRGAEIGGDFNLTAGEILQIVVGGAGGTGAGNGAGGGGGGSFVVGPGNTPLVIAGGGGGGGGFVGTGLPGQGGLTGQDGGGPRGGVGGDGGAAGGLGGGGGGGFFSAGADSVIGGTLLAGGGGAFPGLAGGVNPFEPARDGGFGGGGAGRGFAGSAGGGGGYSGGGTQIGGGLGGVASGGGGGSFDAGTDQILVADFRTGNSEVVITELVAAVPEPASIALLSAGLAGVAAIRRRRRHT
jgi:hypothetical protein